MTPLILSLVFVVIVAFSALVGFARGFSKTVVRLITLAIAIVATFILSGVITNVIAEKVMIEGLTLGELVLSSIKGEEMIDGILASAPLLEEAILVAPEFVIGFVVFPVAFLLLSFISWILFLILSRPLRRLFFKEKGKVKVRAGKRFAGFGMGIVTGALIFAMLMAPLYGLLSVLPEKSALEEVVDTLEEQGALDSATADIIKGELALFDSPIYTIPTAIGVTPIGRAYLSSVSRIERDGEVTSITDEFATLFAVVETAIKGELITAIQNSAEDQTALYTALANEAFMQELIGDMFNSKLLRSAIPEVTAIALEATARMLGVPENKQEVYDNMMGDIAGLVQESEVDFDAIHAYEEANNITYADLMYADEQNTLMTEEEYKNEIKKLDDLEKKISKILSKTVSGSTAVIADGIAKSFMKGIKEQAKTEGAESLKNFDPAKAQQKMAEIDASDIVAEGADNAAIASVLGKVKSPETFETLLATVETVAASIRDTVKTAVKDDSKANETANTLASVVSNFAGAVATATDTNGNIDPMKLDFEKVGNAVGALQGSTLNGVGSAVLDIVVSGDLGKDEMIGSAISGIKDAYNEGKPIADTVKTAGDVIQVVDAMNKSEGEATEDFAKSFEKLVRGLKESTLDLLPDIFTTEVLVSFGIPEKQAEPSFKVIETLLRELVKLQGAENYDNEVNAVISLYNLATSDLDNLEEEDIPMVVDYAVKSDAIYNTLKSISDSNPFGIELEDEEDRKQCADELEEHYNEAMETVPASEKQRLYDVYSAIAKLVGVEDMVEFAK